MLKWFASLLTAVALLWCLPMSVSAHDAVDVDRDCVVSITMHCGGKPVGGGTLSLYRVGQVHQENGNYSFLPAGSFADCGFDFTEIASASLAADLYQYAKDRNIATTAYPVGDDGYLAFRVEPGLYLMAQETAAPGYEKMKPFLVSVPVMRDGVYVYTVDASPKMELVTATPTPTPSVSPPPKLPQTGQLNWPVPILALGGLALLACGWALRYAGKREDEDA